MSLKHDVTIALGKLDCRDAIPVLFRQLEALGHRNSEAQALASMPDARVFTPQLDVLKKLLRSLSWAKVSFWFTALSNPQTSFATH